MPYSVHMCCYTEYEACSRAVEQQHLRDRRSGEDRSNGDMPHGRGEGCRHAERGCEKRLVYPACPRNYDERERRV